jgi:hypothetical protein
MKTQNHALFFIFAVIQELLLLAAHIRQQQATCTHWSEVSYMYINHLFTSALKKSVVSTLLEVVVELGRLSA